MPSEEQVVQLLEELGLTQYEAWCFVALSRVSKATAKEVSDLSEVPRSRVYDAVDRLHKRGLVDVQQSEPREYQAIPPEAALEDLLEQYQSTVENATAAFDQLKQTETREQSGAWAIANHDHVTERIVSLIDDAMNEVYLLVVEEELSEPQVTDRLAAASDRDASVIVEVPSEEIQATFEKAVPDAVVRKTALASSSSEVDGKWLGRMLMTDRRSALISSVAEGIRPDHSEETAIWASGADHGLVVGLRHLLGLRIDNGDITGELN